MTRKRLVSPVVKGLTLFKHLPYGKKKIEIMFKKLFTRTSRSKRKENYTVSSQESQIFLRLRRIFKGS